MRWMIISLIVGGAVAFGQTERNQEGTPGPTTAEAVDTLDVATAARFAELALACIHQEYPNKISHVMNSAEDAKTPHELTPVFFGCYDWHSAVHGHWLLVRLCRMYPEAPFAHPARAALARSFAADKVAAEVAYMRGEGRALFERPYGLAWLLQLCAELHEWDDPQAREWAGCLGPLEQEAAVRFKAWLPKLSYPVRTGEHTQTAFALGLVLDWACSRGDKEMADLVAQRARRYFLNDRAANLAYEPDGQAFLSPILAEADVMRRVLPPAEFAKWLDGFLPSLATADPAEWLRPVMVTDKRDGHLVHLDGLNLSRAWMLDGIADGLPPSDPRITRVRAAAREHRLAGLAALRDQHYEGGHWLGSFAVYLTTERWKTSNVE